MWLTPGPPGAPQTDGVLEALWCAAQCLRAGNVLTGLLGQINEMCRRCQKQNIRIRRPIRVIDPDHVTLMTQSWALLPASNRRCRAEVVYRSPEVTRGHQRS